MTNYIPIIVVAAVAGLIFSSLLVCALSHSSSSSSSNRGKARHGAFGQSLEASIQNAAQLRLQQELYTENGEAVWISHQIHQGQLRQWVVITHDSKYEIRRVRPQPKPAADIDLESGHIGADGWIRIGAGEAQYEYRSQPCKIENERVMAATSRSPDSPPVDALSPSLIGWTQLSKYEVETMWVSLLERFGPYDILWNNCQHFLRDFASSIIQEKAEDWVFFFSKASSNYQRSMRGGHLGHLASITASLERMKAMQPQVEGLERHRLNINIKHTEEHIRNQKALWGRDLPVDLADASDEFILEACDEGGLFDNSGIANSFGELGGSVADYSSGSGGDSGGGDGGGDGGGGGGGGGD